VSETAIETPPSDKAPEESTTPIESVQRESTLPEKTEAAVTEENVPLVLGDTFPTVLDYLFEIGPVLREGAADYADFGMILNEESMKSFFGENVQYYGAVKDFGQYAWNIFTHSDDDSRTVSAFYILEANDPEVLAQTFLDTCANMTTRYGGAPEVILYGFSNHVIDPTYDDIVEAFRFYNEVGSPVEASAKWLPTTADDESSEITFSITALHDDTTIMISTI
jgi:hypothetical protein